MNSRPYKAYTSIAPPTKCVDGRPVPNCANKYGLRGTDINYQKCICEPTCPEGQYEVPQYSGRCGSKADYDKNKAYEKRMFACHGVWTTEGEGRCIDPKDIPSQLDYLVDIPIPWIIAGGLGLLVIILLVTRK